MRAIEVARALKSGADPAAAAALFLKSLAEEKAPLLNDVAALTHRFAQHSPPPAPHFFCAVDAHLRSTLLAPECGWMDRVSVGAPETAPSVSGVSAVVLAEAFARVNYTDGIDALGLLCLGVPPTAALASQELLRFGRACVTLGAQCNAGVRSFLLLRFKAIARRLEPSDLAEGAALLARASIYSPDVSAQIELLLTGDPCCFELRDLKRLLPHFQSWRLGLTQRRAFQRFGVRFTDFTEELSPHDALLAIDTFTQVGSVHEVLLHHLYLRLLLERSFTALPPAGIAKLTASMTKVQHYHTGLLREIVAHLSEDPSIVGKWGSAELSGAIRSFGLAPVSLPGPMLRLFGCRYGTLLPDMAGTELREFFEVGTRFPELVRVVLSGGSARSLPPLLQVAAPEWGLRACADAALGLLLALDSPPGLANGPMGCACTAATTTGDEIAPLPSRAFRTNQPEDQLRVIMRVARNIRQGHFKQTAAHSEVLTGSMLNDMFVADSPKSAEPTTSLAMLRCAATWALPSRRKRRLLPTMDASPLIALILPHLVHRFRLEGHALGELPGITPSIAALLAPEDDAEGLLTPSVHSLLPSAVVPSEVQQQVQQAFEDIPEFTQPDDLAGGRRAEMDGSLGREMEVMRRSELLEVCVQIFAVLQLCLAPTMRPSLPHLPLESCRMLARILPLVTFALRPRRLDDEIAQKHNLGPLRLEAFVRRPDAELTKEVHYTLGRLVPFIPRFMGWAEWPARRVDRLLGEETGGAFLSLKREVEVSPFVICFVLRRKSVHRVRTTEDEDSCNEVAGLGDEPVLAYLEA